MTDVFSLQPRIEKERPSKRQHWSESKPDYLWYSSTRERKQSKIAVHRMPFIHHSPAATTVGYHLKQWCCVSSHPHAHIVVQESTKEALRHQSLNQDNVLYYLGRLVASDTEYSTVVARLMQLCFCLSLRFPSQLVLSG